MSKTTAFGFQLEADDRSEEERARERRRYENGPGSSSDAPRAPMDTDYQEEMDPLKPQIRFNLNFDK